MGNHTVPSAIFSTSGRIRTGSRFLQVSPSFIAAMRRWSASLRMACMGTWTTESRRQPSRGNRVSLPRSLMNRDFSSSSTAPLSSVLGSTYASIKTIPLPLSSAARRAACIPIIHTAQAKCNSNSRLFPENPSKNHGSPAGRRQGPVW